MHNAKLLYYEAIWMFYTDYLLVFGHSSWTFKFESGLESQGEGLSQRLKKPFRFIRLVWYTNRSSNLFHPQTPGWKSQLQHKTGKVHYSLSVKRCSTSGSGARRWVASINTVWREHVLQGFFSHHPSISCLSCVSISSGWIWKLSLVTSALSSMLNFSARVRARVNESIPAAHVSWRLWFRPRFHRFSGCRRWNVSSSLGGFTFLLSDTSLLRKIKKLGRGLRDETIPQFNRGVSLWILAKAQQNLPNNAQHSLQTQPDFHLPH